MNTARQTLPASTTYITKMLINKPPVKPAVCLGKNSCSALLLCIPRQNNMKSSAFMFLAGNNYLPAAEVNYPFSQGQAQAIALSRMGVIPLVELFKDAFLHRRAHPRAVISNRYPNLIPLLA